MIEKVKEIVDSVASVGKVMLLSGRPSASGEVKKEKLIVMGNGPSFKDVLENHPEVLEHNHTLAVNYAANTDAFRQVRPNLYVLADPHFFGVDSAGQPSDPIVARLWDNLASADWEMTLYVPCKKKIPESIEKNANITVKRYNLTPVEGTKFPAHWLYRKGLGMPRPRNVLIASVMLALRDGYRDIYLVGADHSWSRDLRVDDDNHVVYVLNHFYKDNDKEHKRVDKFYEDYRLHDIFRSLMIAFRSYHQIKKYADEMGAHITNCTPGSFIDAFRRADISKLEK